MSLSRRTLVGYFAASISLCSAQQPSMTGPLQLPAPHTFDAGPLGTLSLNGIASGVALVQGNHAGSDATAQADLSNGQIFIQKTSGWWQFNIQAGAYNLPIVATPFLSTADNVTNLWGPLPVAYLTLAPSKNFSILIGKLPSLMGAEYTFDFENMNVERGLLWNQENSINRGIQVNDTLGKLSLSASWNDGFYSNRYTWITGSLAYQINAANSLSFVAGGNLGHTAFRTGATPIQNNSSIYDVIYSLKKGDWIVQPYFQYTNLPTDLKADVPSGAAARGGALLVTYNFKHHLSLSGRGEYISSTGSAIGQAVNLLFGPGSGGWSITVTPTFQDHDFFVRGEFSFLRATQYTPGDAFGLLGMNQAQSRGTIEAGFLF